MPTGPSHLDLDTPDGIPRLCRCMIGVNHGNDDGDDDDEGEALSVYDAADIWLSNGMDEDYTFGYSEDELRAASGNW